MLNLWVSLLLGTASGARVDVDLPTLCGFADHVVIAEVTSQEVLWAAGERGGIETRSWLALERVVRGAPPEAQVVTPGGALGELVQDVEDAASLRVDARYLLLLRDTADGFEVVGGETGAILLPHRSADPGDEAARAAIASVGTCR